MNGFFRFWYDFIVGDDWRVAVGVAASIVVGAVLVSSTALPHQAIAILFLVGVVTSLLVSLRVVVKAQKD